MITYDRLSQIIPSDQALANKALSTSLKQIAGVADMSLPQLAITSAKIQTNKDLPLINSLTQALPDDVYNYYINTLADGTGPNGQIRVVDIIGLAIGWNAIDNLGTVVSTLTTMNTATLTTVYQTMSNAVDGVYGDPVAGPVVVPSGPYAGSYASAEDLISTVLLPAAQTEITTLVAAYPTQVVTLNQAFTNMANQLVGEQTLQTKANIDFINTLASDPNSIYGFVFSLPDYGLQTEVGGMAQFIESMADLSTQGGQAVVAVMRQGRSQTVLNNFGITTNSDIPLAPNPLPPQATLLPSIYTEEEAIAALSPKL